MNIDQTVHIFYYLIASLVPCMLWLRKHRIWVHIRGIEGTDHSSWTIIVFIHFSHFFKKTTTILLYYCWARPKYNHFSLLAVQDWRSLSLWRKWENHILLKNNKILIDQKKFYYHFFTIMMSYDISVCECSISDFKSKLKVGIRFSTSSMRRNLSTN